MLEDKEKQALKRVAKLGMISECEKQDGCWTNIVSPDFGQRQPSRGYLASPGSGLSNLNDAKKNCLWLLRGSPSQFLRSERAAGQGFPLRRETDLSGRQDAAGYVPPVWESEAGKTAMAGGQHFLHQTLRFFCGEEMSVNDAPLLDVAKEVRLDWKTVKAMDIWYMEEQLRRAKNVRPEIIGIDELSIRKGHEYRIVISDLEKGLPIWFGGKDRSEESLDGFYHWLGPKQGKNIRLAVMDMWKAFEKSTRKNVPGAAILYDKFHVTRHLGEALNKVRKQEYARLSDEDRKYIKGQKWVLLSNRENLTLDGKASLRALLRANKRLQTAYLLKESFG